MQQEVSANQVWLELLCENDHSQELLTSHTVLAFCLAQQSAAICHNPLLALLISLRQYCTHPYTAGICVQNEWSFKVGIS